MLAAAVQEIHEDEQKTTIPATLHIFPKRRLEKQGTNRLCQFVKRKTVFCNKRRCLFCYQMEFDIAVIPVTTIAAGSIQTAESKLVNGAYMAEGRRLTQKVSGRFQRKLQIPGAVTRETTPTVG